MTDSADNKKTASPRTRRRRTRRPRSQAQQRSSETSSSRPKRRRRSRKRSSNEKIGDTPPLEKTVTSSPIPREEEDDDSTSFFADTGESDDAPPAAVTLQPDLPPVPSDEFEQIPFTDGHAPASLPTQEIRNVVGIKLAQTGRVCSYDGGNQTFHRGQQVVVETERGTRLGTVSVPSLRKPSQALPRVLRRPNRSDLQSFTRTQEYIQNCLHTARDRVRDLGLPIKIYRADASHPKSRIRIYFSSEERIDFRELVGDLARTLRTRVEMRQTGVRDEAKATGGIGSCGRELCCTTWLPEFVPVSIKMVKDQGLALNPTKVSGQCGRLKCCLVYEQETYAQLRKGLPRLGKRVITEFGEGRVVEVDVLRQRIRVSFGHGESKSLPKDQVKPMFPSQPQGKTSKKTIVP